MKAGVRKTIEMAGRARDFSRAHPSSDECYAGLLAGLEDGLDRASLADTKQRAATIAVHATTERRLAIRKALHEHLLRHLVLVGQDAEKEGPELKLRYRLPSINAPNLAYLNAARAMYAEALAERERFRRHGLADHLMDDLGAKLDEYDALVADANNGQGDRVWAVTALDAIGKELAHRVLMMDGHNRYRFREDAPVLAAWKSLKKIARPAHAAQASEPAPERSAEDPGPAKQVAGLLAPPAPTWS